MSSPRRDGDDVEDDHRKERRGGLGRIDSLTKWVVGAFCVLLLGALTTLAARDRASIDLKDKEQDERILALEQLSRNLAIQQAGTDARWDEVKRTLARIEGDVKDLKRR
jgi:hypothetical protein